MPAFIIKIITFFITPIFGLFINKNLLEYKKINSVVKCLLLIVFLALVNFAFYSTDYKIITTIATYILSILIYKIIFDIRLQKSFISTSIMMILIIFADLIMSTALSPFFSASQIRTNSILMLIGNILVGIIAILLSMLNLVKKIFNNFYKKYESNKYIEFIVFSILIILALCVLGYNFSRNYRFDLEYMVNFITMLIFFLLVYIFALETKEYNDLNKDYDVLFNCIKTFEDWLENDSLNRHEHKNQLAYLNEITTDKKAKKYIEGILKENKKLSKDYNYMMKYIPKGGIKGLLYYKLKQCEDLKIDVVLDISEKVTKPLEKLSENDMKTISRLIGIYIDNAKEAVVENKSLKLSIEIYLIKKEINIVISNIIKANVNINDFSKKGYSTKGKGHGNGLYFAKKLADGNKKIKLESQRINDYYIQKIIIK